MGFHIVIQASASRRLRDMIFEYRVGLKLRLIFNTEPGILSFTDLGTHDEIRDKTKDR